MATARLLMMFAIAFHRGNQWCNANLTFPYPTLPHARNANNKRADMEDSLDLLIDMFMQVIEAEKSEALIASATGEEGVDSNNEISLSIERFMLQLSAANHDGERRPRQSTKSQQRTPAAVGLAAPAIKSERTPRYHNKKAKDETHVGRV
jgi:hypothetical protein